MNERELFHAALELASPEERAAYLHGACGKDVALLSKVEALLKEHFSDDEVIAKLAVEETRPTEAVAPYEAAPARMIGRYKLLERIGEGGFGEVWMAEQREPVRRRVALKVIKLGMDTKQVVARFEAERQALAMMDHPNIAKILDAGATGEQADVRSQKAEVRESPALRPDSDLPHAAFNPLTSGSVRPYFVMELVRGIKITDYCDQNQLSTNQRLKLFIQVCQAIQHAHQKGIIHRDIKPSNVLVTLHDGMPVPKVIDFGIAKATQQELTDKTIFTQFQQFIGTPAYISPEQAEMSGLDIDTRADIYSLGVLLYELLVGQTPFDAKEMLKGGLDAMRKIIREKEPQRPSTRIASLREEERTTTAKHRSVDAPKLVHLLEGDLDWIVMKTLEKDRTRRYETANGLAMDITRYLTHEPVVARPPSAAYKLHKAFQRNKLAFSAGAIVALSLIAGIALTTWQAAVATKAKNQATLAKAETAREAQAAQKERDKAVEMRNQADELRQRAEASERSAHQLLYTANMNLARQSWEQDNLGRLRQLLRETELHPGRGFEWYYWLRRTRLDLRTFFGHTGAVHSSVFSPDGRQMVTGSMDATARIWDPGSGRELFTLRGHLGPIECVAFSPDGSRVATAGRERSAKVWDAARGKELLDLKGHSNSVHAVAFSPDGRWVVTASYDTTARVWDAATGRELFILTSPGNKLACVAFSPDGRQLLVGHDKRWPELWDLSARQVLRTFHGHGDYITAVAFSPDGLTIATSSKDRTARTWDPFTGQERMVFRSHTDRVMSVAFSPDGKRLLTGSDDHAVKVWDVSSGKEGFTLKGHDRGVLSAVFSPDGQRVLTSSYDRTSKIWDAVNGEEYLTVQGRGARVSTVAFSPDGKRFVTANGRSAKVWDAATRRELLDLIGHTDRTMSAVFSPDGKRILTGSYDRTAKIWDAATGREGLTLAGHSDLVRCVAFSPDGRRVVTAGEDMTAIIWDATTGTALRTLKGHAERIKSAVFSPDGRRILTCGGDSTARIWDADNGSEILVLRVDALENPDITSGCFSPDGLRVVTGNGMFLKMWDSRSGKQLRILAGHGKSIYALAYAPDGTRIVSGSDDHTAKVWDAATGEELLLLKGHSDGVRSVAVSPDGRTILTGSDDTTVRIWETATDSQVADWEQEQKIALDGGRPPSL